MAYDIFISYRRKGGHATAKHLYDLLTHDGYSVSFDIDTLRNGDFDTELLKRIDECTDFILILNETAFDRCLDPAFDRKRDWLRNELAYALEKRKNIIPIMLGGFTEFPDNLPEDIAGVARKNGPKYDEYYFDDFYRKLKNIFLDTPAPTINLKANIDSQLIDTNIGALIRVHPDMECRIEKYGEVLGVAAAEQYFPIRLRKGKHILKFISTQDERDSLEITHIVEDVEIEDLLEIHIAEGAYEGEIRNGLRWGKGKCVYSDGTIYEGEWENGMSKGKGRGVLTLDNGKCYEGGLLDVNAINFPDAVFRNYILRRYAKNGFLTDETNKRILSLSPGHSFDDIGFISFGDKIRSLKGIEFFTELEKLNCSGHQLTSLDVSKNTKLRELECHSNQLTFLDLSQNNKLTRLSCWKNQLTSLTISPNNLEYLECGRNQLTSLDVSNCGELLYLYCSNNQLLSLTMLKNEKLRFLECSNNQLALLDVSKNKNLSALECQANKLALLDISKNKELRSLHCEENQLRSLDISKNLELVKLWCENNQLMTLDVSNNIKLEELHCGDNQLTLLNISEENSKLRHWGAIEEIKIVKK